MSDSKVYMFPESGDSNLLSLLVPMLSLKGVDPNVLLAMLNRNDGFGEGSWFIWIIFLLFFSGAWGNNGFGGFGGNRYGCEGAGLANLINNDSGRELLMSAIQGNGTAISQLATTLNCSVNDIRTAITGVMSQVQGVGNQVGMSAQQIINAIQSGNCSIASKIADCCCENRLAICQLTNTLQNAINGVAVGQERGFSSVAYETQRQTCDLEKSIASATESILAGQRSAELREMQNKIDSLREANAQKDTMLNNCQLTATFSQMIQNATAPLAGALANLQSDISSVKCKLPETVTLPSTQNVVVPSCVAANYGLCGFGGYNNSLWG